MIPSVSIERSCAISPRRSVASASLHAAPAGRLHPSGHAQPPGLPRQWRQWRLIPTTAFFFCLWMAQLAAAANVAHYGEQGVAKAATERDAMPACSVGRFLHMHTHTHTFASHRALSMQPWRRSDMAPWLRLGLGKVQASAARPRSTRSATNAPAEPRNTPPLFSFGTPPEGIALVHFQRSYSVTPSSTQDAGPLSGRRPRSICCSIQGHRITNPYPPFTFSRCPFEDKDTCVSRHTSRPCVTRETTMRWQISSTQLENISREHSKP